MKRAYRISSIKLPSPFINFRSRKVVLLKGGFNNRGRGLIKYFQIAVLLIDIHRHYRIPCMIRQTLLFKQTVHVILFTHVMCSLIYCEATIVAAMTDITRCENLQFTLNRRWGLLIFLSLKGGLISMQGGLIEVGAI